MLIRPAKFADIPAIIEVEISAGALFEGTHMDWAVGETSTVDSLRECIAQNQVWVAEVDGMVVGYGCGMDLDGSFYIEEVSVGRSHHRQGIGRMLIDHMAGEARNLGYRAVTLTTDRTLPWNAPYYERLGFSIMKDSELSPQLRAALDEKPEPQRRCAMVRPI